MISYPLVSNGERFPFVAPDARGFVLGDPVDDGDRFAGVLQGVGFIERLCFDYLHLLGAPIDGSLILTGGATKSAYWCQLRADILGRPVTLPDNAEPALGMAVLAASPGRSAADVAAEMVRVRDGHRPAAGHGRQVRRRLPGVRHRTGTPRVASTRRRNARPRKDIPMTYLVLVRHGETVWHAENRYAGCSDIALTPRGLEQAAQLTAWARTARLDGVWASTLSRAQITAKASADISGTPLHIDARLRELDFGAAEGLTTAEMTEKFPDALAAFRADPVAHHFPGGEDPVKAADRFVDALHDIADTHPDGRVLVVAHTTAIRLALCQLIGVPLSNYRRLFPFVRNCGLTEIRLRAGEVAVMEFNTPIEPEGFRAAGAPVPLPAT